jgi:glycerophosphoryl diester phosphodiesterase
MEVLLARNEHERWLISSFRLETVDRCRAIADAAGAGVRTAWLTTLVGDGTGQIEPLEHVVASLVAAGHTAVHPWVKLLRRDVVDACHAQGLAVNPWTCDDPERMAELVEWGIDGICTNLPDVALRVLGRGAPA